MPVITINSDDLIQIDEHFKVTAGPGAGKTHWLVNHIKNVLRNSDRLGCYRKISCITYTNTAVDTITGRLNEGLDRVEVSTIHSFVYNNIIKPYMHFIAAQYDFNVKYMDGHDEHFPSRNYIKEWIDSHVNLNTLRSPFSRDQILRRPENLLALKNWLSSISYEFTGTNIEISTDNSKAVDWHSSTRLGKTNCLVKLIPGLMDYKKIFWRKGRLHHEDVLFFGYKLVTEYPFIISVLQAKFPYFFIDEFQDTSPVQTAILKLIAAKETIVGVIGDKAQAIYSFQGASSNDFQHFTLPRQQDYVIADNRRSTNQIVEALNHLRSDIHQHPLRGVIGAKPVIFVGTKEDAYNFAQGICGGENLVCLSRNNVTVNSMKQVYNSGIPTINLTDELFTRDASERAKIIIRCVKAVELGLEKRFKEAIKELEKINAPITDKFSRKKKSFQQLSSLLSRFSAYKDEPLLKFYELVKSEINPSMSAVTRGAIKIFYETYSYAQLALFVNTQNEVSNCKTIHKAKGDEFDNVLVTMVTAAETTYISTPNLGSEEQRIRYVGLSRAKERLFINVPALDLEQEASLIAFFDVQR